MKDSTFPIKIPPLFSTWLALIAAHRPAYCQEYTYQRALALVCSEPFSFARRTVTQALLALELTDADWSAWYRLLSRLRIDEEALASC